MKEMAELERFKDNPFIKDMELSIRSKRINLQRIGDKASNSTTLIDNNGEYHGTYVATTKRVDEAQFLKLFTSNIALTFDLKASGIKAFNVLCSVMQNSIEKDKIIIDKYTLEDFNKTFEKKLSRAVLYRGIGELIDCQIMARSVRESEYFINPNFVFNGDRIVFATIIEKEKSKTDKEGNLIPIKEEDK